MKINIKGFTFVGFAAAIFAMNAMAANQANAVNTVTSRSYVDAKISSSTSISDTSTTTAPNEAAVYSELAGKQPIQNTANYKVGQSGAWQPLNSAVAVANGGYLAKTNETDGSVTLNIDTTSQLQTSGDNLNTESGKLITEGAVAQAIADVSSGANSALQAKSTADFQFGGESGVWKTVESGTYIAAPVAGTAANSAKIDLDSNKITSTFNSSNGLSDTSTNLIQEGIVAQAIADAIADQSAEDEAAYQPINDSAKLQVATVDTNGDATWASMNDALNTGTYTTKTYDSTTGVVTIEANGTTDTTLASDGETGKLPTAATVKTYVDDAISAATGDNTIPGMNTSICTDSTPCALVAEVDGLHWRTMATADSAGGTLGDLVSGN